MKIIISSFSLLFRQLYLYLDTLCQKDWDTSKKFHIYLVELYADYNPEKLLQFLKSSDHYPIQVIFRMTLISKTYAHFQILVENYSISGTLNTARYFKFYLPEVNLKKSNRIASKIKSYFTGKSLSEALLFAEHGENMLCTKVVLNVRNNFCTQHVLPRFELGIFMY